MKDVFFFDGAIIGGDINQTSITYDQLCAIAELSGSNLNTVGKTYPELFNFVFDEMKIKRIAIINTRYLETVKVLVTIARSELFKDETETPQLNFLKLFCAGLDGSEETKLLKIQKEGILE
jgi:hypothetical protein